MKIRSYSSKIVIAALAATLAAPVFAASTNPGYRTNALASNARGLGRFDARIVNPWGLAIDTSRMFVAENGSGVITIHNLSGVPSRTSIFVPTPTGISNGAAPTGVVLNRTRGFAVTSGTRVRPATILFATENGTIGGWNPAVSATNGFTVVDNSGSNGAVYKSLAITATTPTDGPALYAANFKGGFIEQYSSNFTLVRTFTDSNAPAGFAPFGLRIIQQKLFVAFAKQLGPDNIDDEPGPGNGFIDIFTLEGELVRSYGSSTNLNSPWGMALAPSHFGRLSGNLLVGNFGDGQINAFNIITGESLGPIVDRTGLPITLPGLWAIDFGRDPAEGRFDFESNGMIFTEGPNGEANGVIGSLRAISPFLAPIR